MDEIIGPTTNENDKCMTGKSITLLPGVQMRFSAFQVICMVCHREPGEAIYAGFPGPVGCRMIVNCNVHRLLLAKNHNMDMQYTN
ncbi:MAG: hypothetical protein C0396_03170 [Anaerolinea sp.]|nr:hypothetical protein [Anaerolinea sp.]